MTPPDDQGTCPPTAPRKPIPQPQRIEHALAYHRGNVTRLAGIALERAQAGPAMTARDAAPLKNIAALMVAQGEAMLRSAHKVKERAATMPATTAEALRQYAALFELLAQALNRLVDAINQSKEANPDDR